MIRAAEPAEVGTDVAAPVPGPIIFDARQLHKSGGLRLSALTLVRLIRWLIGPAPVLPARKPVSEKRAANERQGTCASNARCPVDTRNRRKRRNGRKLGPGETVSPGLLGGIQSGYLCVSAQNKGIGKISPGNWGAE